MIIRRETEKDYREVENLTREAFWNVYRPGCFEHLAAHNLRSDKAFIPELDYVIEEDGRIIANIMYARAEIRGENGAVYDIAVFGPLSVLPEKQGRGCGSRLVSHTLALAKEMGIPLVAITGSPEYYRRFGFVPASNLGIYIDGAPRSEETPFFMVKVLDEERASKIRGVYSDPPVYTVTEADVDEFDKAFPAKVKEVREGQLK